MTRDRRGEVWERLVEGREGSLFVVTATRPGSHNILWLESGKESRMEERPNRGWDRAERLKRFA